jgi:hypothetical protein
MPATVRTATSFLGVPVLLLSMLLNVVACVTWLTVVDVALLDWCYLLASWRGLLVDGNLSLVVCRLDMSL